MRSKAARFEASAVLVAIAGEIEVTLRSHERNQELRTEDFQRSLHVVSQNLQAHLGSDSRQRLRQKMSRAHPRLQRSECVLYGLPS